MSDQLNSAKTGEVRKSNNDTTTMPGILKAFEIYMNTPLIYTAYCALNELLHLFSYTVSR